MSESPRPHALYTWTAQRRFVPFPLAGGKGAWFWDDGGRRYLDMASAAANAGAGHNHPRILDAIRGQLDRLAVAAPFMESGIREKTARRLARVTPPGLDRFLFTLGGADAVEHAVKIARLATGRASIVCRVNSYHGATLGALSFSDDPRAEAFRPGLPGIHRVREPSCHRCPWETSPSVCDRPCVEHVGETVRRAGPETIAAILMETIPGTTAGYLPPLDYYRGIRGICDRHGILLILDEVLTGFGRTGRWFAAEHYDVVPDLMALGKGITSGHAPLGCVAVSDRVARCFDDRELATGMTHTAHPVSLAAALGNLEALHEEGLVGRAEALGRHMMDRLERMRRSHAAVVDARGVGLYGCLELDAEVDVQGLKRAAFEQGVHLLARGRCLYVLPPLIISRRDLDHGLDVIDAALARC
ncbi:MAG: aminotransferase class III-fold pyridoxal phosphate-dependent enzyme [Acidobacteriota bacterium]